jgi:hypothetical protein
VKLGEWHQVLATAPATPNQRGAIMGEFERLGFEEADRAERLAICAALAGLENLGSTADLTMGQAGQLYRMLLDIGDRDELLAAAGLADEDQAAEIDEDQADEQQPAGLTIAEAIKQLILAFVIGQYVRENRAPYVRPYVCPPAREPGFNRSPGEAETGDDRD